MREFSDAFSLSSLVLSLPLCTKRVRSYLEQARPGGHGCQKERANRERTRAKRESSFRRRETKKVKQRSPLHTHKKRLIRACLFRALRRAARPPRAPRLPAAVSHWTPWLQNSQSVRLSDDARRRKTRKRIERAFEKLGCRIRVASTATSTSSCLSVCLSLSPPPPLSRPLPPLSLSLRVRALAAVPLLPDSLTLQTPPKKLPSSLPSQTPPSSATSPPRCAPRASAPRRAGGCPARARTDTARPSSL